MLRFVLSIGCGVCNKRRLGIRRITHRRCAKNLLRKTTTLRLCGKLSYAGCVPAFLLRKTRKIWFLDFQTFLGWGLCRALICTRLAASGRATSTDWESGGLPTVGAAAGRATSIYWDKVGMLAAGVALICTRQAAAGRATSIYWDKVGMPAAGAGLLHSNR